MKTNNISKHTQLGVLNSEVDHNQVEAQIAFLLIHLRTTASIMGVIALFLEILCLCQCGTRNNIKALYHFVCLQKCRPKVKRQPDI